MFSYIPFNWNLFIPLFILQKLKNMSMGDVCGFNCHLVLASVPTHLSTPSPHLRKVTLLNFGSRWIGRMEFAACFELPNK
jgi:hypothetical protein